jgi:hypothetical protein
MWKEREPTAREEPMIDERRSSDKGGTPNEPTAEGAEAAYMRYSKTTSAPHSSKPTKPRLRRRRYQRDADHNYCRESSEFLVDHAVLLFRQQPPSTI